ncbi:MAG: flavodoxin [Lachnospiraceae bacterium]|nr:flavodoxin [Lachnospiraceae bacterium]
MKNRKLACMMAAVLAAGMLAGCSSGSSSAETTAAAAETTDEAAETTTAESEAASEETEAESGSEESVSGAEETSAEESASQEAAGGDLFELEPAEPYTDEDLDWTNDNSRVTVEHDNPDQRDVELVSDTVDNWEDYDTVLIGYPIWWGIAAWPVDTFVEANDFTGKTVIPFCTSSSSNLGESGQLLAEMAGTGDWQEGMRFRSGVDEADVVDWVESLGL